MNPGATGGELPSLRDSRFHTLPGLKFTLSEAEGTWLTKFRRSPGLSYSIRNCRQDSCVLAADRDCFSDVRIAPKTYCVAAAALFASAEPVKVETVMPL
jgi:hypothetical protein